MRTARIVLCALVLLMASCGDENGDGVEDVIELEFPHTVTLKVEQALVAPTGQIIENADFVKGDIVTFTNQTIKINSGGPKLTDCLPLHICRPSPSSKPDTFESLDQVCMIPPTLDESSTIPNAETGMGFTVKLNSAEGCARVWVKEVKGIGGSASATLVYSLFNCVL